MSYIDNLLIGISQFGNALLGGQPGETISGRVGRAAAAGGRMVIILEAAINLVFAVLRGHRHHCASAAGGDK